MATAREAALPAGRGPELRRAWLDPATASLAAWDTRLETLRRAAVAGDRDNFRAIAETEWIVDLDDRDAVRVTPTGRTAGHALLRTLRERGHPGLVLFSSGSTGASKAAVHDLVPLLAKFEVRKRTLRTIAFLLFDHIGGVNTLLYALSNGGCVITVSDRKPDAVCAAVKRLRAEIEAD